MAKTKQDPSDYIVSLNMNGLQGRMLQLPAKNPQNNREILALYGHHALIERWWGLIQNLNEYGAVTMPDIPGFGGMDPFYKIGRKPTIDAYADYLAAFIKMRYKRRRVTIVGISFGFIVATRMLQRYPELAKKVDLLVSLVGFMHKDDFCFKPLNQKFYQLLAAFFSTPAIAFTIRYGFLNKPMIKALYARLPAGKRRLFDMDPEEFNLLIDFDTTLWHKNDVRTHWATTSEFLGFNNCTSRIDLPVWHVASKTDPYFKNELVVQHMHATFTECNETFINTKSHTPDLLADKKQMGVLLPPKLRRQLSRR
jgi:pimeloyl-ACP methyl ester carboxylesterase